MRRLILALALCSAIGCSSVKPGVDPKVARAEQALQASDVIYKSAMEFYFTPGTASSMAPGTRSLFEKLRTQYDPAWQSVYAAILLYDAGHSGALNSPLASLAALVNQVLEFLPPLLGLKPIVVSP